MRKKPSEYHEIALKVKCTSRVRVIYIYIHVQVLMVAISIVHDAVAAFVSVSLR